MADAKQHYDIVFRGDIVIGHQLDEVKTRLRQLFKADTARIDALFSGRPVTLKRNLDAATAKKYQAVLQQAGAEVSVSAAGAQDKPRPAAKRGFTLAPVGASLLRATGRRQTEAPEVDTSALSLAPADGRLVEQSEVANSERAAIAVPELDVAPVGADVLSAQERSKPSVAPVEVANWELTAEGEDLLKPDEHTAPLPLIVADLEADLAPVGSELGQLPDTRQPLAPDTSKFTLAD